MKFLNLKCTWAAKERVAPPQFLFTQQVLIIERGLRNCQSVVRMSRLDVATMKRKWHRSNNTIFPTRFVNLYCVLCSVVGFSIFQPHMKCSTLNIWHSFSFWCSLIQLQLLLRIYHSIYYTHRERERLFFFIFLWGL